MIRRIRRALLNKFLRHALHVVPEEDIMRVHKGKIWVGGERLSQEQEKKIKRDASTMRNMPLYELLRRDMKEHAYYYGFVKAQTEEDMLVGKVLYHYINSVDKRLREIAEE